ncbi:MAG: hypothetical protein JJ899_18120, partial [Alphaproteobacteria bacterium]|nr:hypothetical protein [Alphaproteobacteria bacterium]
EISVPELGAYEILGTIEGAAEAPALTDLFATIGLDQSYVVTITDGSVGDITTGRGIDVGFHAVGAEIQPFARRLTIGAPALGAFDIAGRVLGDPDDLILSDLSGTVGAEETIQIDVRSAGVADLNDGTGLAANVALRGSSTQSLGDKFGAPIPELGAFDLKGFVFGSVDEFSLAEIEGRIGNGSTIGVEVSEGAIYDLNRGRGIDALVRARGTEIGALADVFSADVPRLGAYDLRAHVSGSVDDLTLANLNGTLGTARTHRFRIEDGRVGNVVDGTGIDADIHAQGRSVAQVAAIFGSEAPELGSYDVRGHISGSTAELAVSRLNGTIGTERALALNVRNGRVANLAKGTGLKADVVARGGNIADAARIFDIPIYSRGAFRLQTSIAGSLAKPNLDDVDLAIDLPGAQIRADGMVRIDDDTLEHFDLIVRAQAQSLERFSPLFGTELPETARLSADGRAFGTPEKFSVENLSARIADSSARASVALDLSGDVPAIDGSVDFGRLDPAGVFVSDIGAPASAPVSAGVEDDDLPVWLLEELTGDLRLSVGELMLG